MAARIQHSDCDIPIIISSFCLRGSHGFLRIVLRPQGTQCALRDLDEVGLAAAREHDLELGERARRQPHDGLQRLPLRVGVTRSE